MEWNQFEQWKIHPFFLCLKKLLAIVQLVRRVTSNCGKKPCLVSEIAKVLLATLGITTTIIIGVKNS
jgi:hypothetical protein